MFSFAGTGNSDVVYMLAKLELIHRSDLLSLALSYFSSYITDTVCYEVPLYNLNKSELVLALIPSRLESKIQHYDDLSHLPKFPCAGTPYTLLCKSEKIFKHFVTKELENILQSCKNTVKMIYISSKISIVANSNLLIRGTFQQDKNFTVQQLGLLFNFIEKTIVKIKL
jgi:Protein of unknown function (DUF1682)